MDPRTLANLVRFDRFGVDGPLTQVLDRYWTVQWHLPPGRHHDQRVLTHPCANLIVTREPDGDITAILTGVMRRVTTRRLEGSGWAVAAMTAPGALGALLPGSAGALRDRVLPLGEALGVDDAGLVRDLATAACSGWRTWLRPRERHPGRCSACSPSSRGCPPRGCCADDAGGLRSSASRPRRPGLACEAHRLATSAALAFTASAAALSPSRSVAVRSRSTTFLIPPAPISASTPR